MLLFFTYLISMLAFSQIVLADTKQSQNTAVHSRSYFGSILKHSTSGSPTASILSTQAYPGSWRPVNRHAADVPRHVDRKRQNRLIADSVRRLKSTGSIASTNRIIWLNCFFSPVQCGKQDAMHSVEAAVIRVAIEQQLKELVERNRKT